MYSLGSRATPRAAPKIPSVANRECYTSNRKDYAHAALNTTQPHRKFAGKTDCRQRAIPFPPLSLAKRFLAPLSPSSSLTCVDVRVCAYETAFPDLTGVIREMPNRSVSLLRK